MPATVTTTAPHSGSSTRDGPISASAAVTVRARGAATSGQCRRSPAQSRSPATKARASASSRMARSNQTIPSAAARAGTIEGRHDQPVHQGPVGERPRGGGR